MPAVRSQIGVYALEAPAQEGFAFLGRSGWLGARCVCGWIVSGRTMASLELGLGAHQTQATCPEWHRYADAAAVEVEE